MATNITLKLENDEEKALYKKICKERDTTMSQALRKYIREEIANYKKQKNK